MAGEHNGDGRIARVRLAGGSWRLSGRLGRRAGADILEIDGYIERFLPRLLSDRPNR